MALPGWVRLLRGAAVCQIVVDQVIEFALFAGGVERHLLSGLEAELRVAGLQYLSPEDGVDLVFQFIADLHLLALDIEKIESHRRGIARVEDDVAQRPCDECEFAAINILLA